MTGIYEIWKNNKLLFNIEDYNLEFIKLDKVFLEFFRTAKNGDFITIRCELPT